MLSLGRCAQFHLNPNKPKEERRRENECDPPIQIIGRKANITWKKFPWKFYRLSAQLWTLSLSGRRRRRSNKQSKLPHSHHNTTNDLYLRHRRRADAMFRTGSLSQESLVNDAKSIKRWYLQALNKFGRN